MARWSTASSPSPTWPSSTTTSSYIVEGWAEPEHSRGTLRFVDTATLDGFLSEAQLEVSARYGYWDRGPLTDTSTGIITFARPR